MIMYVNTANRGTLNLRQTPSNTGSIIARIPFGTALNTEKVDDTWSQTSYNGFEGYVMNKFLSEVHNSNNDKDKEALKRIYDSLKTTLSLIEEALK